MEVSRGASAHQIAERILSEGDTTKIGLWTAPNGDFRKVSLISTKRWLSFGDFVMGIIHAVASLFSKARPTVSSLYEPRTAEKVGQLFSATLTALEAKKTTVAQAPKTVRVIEEQERVIRAALERLKGVQNRKAEIARVSGEVVGVLADLGTNASFDRRTCIEDMKRFLLNPDFQTTVERPGQEPQVLRDFVHQRESFYTLLHVLGIPNEAPHATINDIRQIAAAAKRQEGQTEEDFQTTVFEAQLARLGDFLGNSENDSSTRQALTFFTSFSQQIAAPFTTSIWNHVKAKVSEVLPDLLPPQPAGSKGQTYRATLTLTNDVPPRIENMRSTYGSSVVLQQAFSQNGDPTPLLHVPIALTTTVRTEPDGFRRISLESSCQESRLDSSPPTAAMNEEDRHTQRRNQQKLLAAMRDMPQQIASFLPASARLGRFSEEAGRAVEQAAEAHTTTMVPCLREQKETDVVAGDLTRLLDRMTFVEQREPADQTHTRTICSRDTGSLEGAARKEKILELLDSFADDEESRAALNEIKGHINRNWTPGADLSHIVSTALKKPDISLPPLLKQFLIGATQTVIGNMQTTLFPLIAERFEMGLMEEDEKAEKLPVFPSVVLTKDPQGKILSMKLEMRFSLFCHKLGSPREGFVLPFTSSVEIKPQTGEVAVSVGVDQSASLSIPTHEQYVPIQQALAHSFSSHTP